MTTEKPKAIPTTFGKIYSADKIDDWLKELSRLLTCNWKDVPEKTKKRFKSWWLSKSRMSSEQQIMDEFGYGSNIETFWAKEWHGDSCSRCEFVAFLFGVEGK